MKQQRLQYIAVKHVHLSCKTSNFLKLVTSFLKQALPLSFDPPSLKRHGQFKRTQLFDLCLFMGYIIL